MTREILFRGKRIDDREWVEGDICRSAQQIYIHPNHNSFRVTKAGLSKLLVMHEINPNTIGQYTGLTDKNEKKIFEGDIVEGFDFCADDDGYGVVTWDDGGFLVSNAFLCGSFVENYNGRDFEVIGNIHDNPELLEEE